MFHLQAHLDNHYQTNQGKFKFAAKNQNELESWQQRFREELTQILGIANRPLPEKPQVEAISVVDKGHYSEEKYVLHVDDVLVPLYLLVPKSAPPHKAILAFHGHGMGVHLILGNYASEEIRATNIALDENFAQRLAEDNYLVCAIEQRGFGERITEQVTEGKNNSCRHLAFEYMMQGMTLMGERVRDGIASINYLLNREDIILDKLGCTGHSGGAATALFLSALDTRITVSVISGYFCDYKQSILGMAHCECNYVPNLLSLGDISDIAALIAPRPLRIVNGKQDPIFPLSGVEKPYQMLEQAYTIAGTSNACSLSLHQGGHQYNYKSSIEWFQQWL